MDTADLLVLIQQVMQQRALHMQTIFSFVDDAALRTIEYFIGDFHVAAHRQAVQENRILRGRTQRLAGHQLFAYTTRLPASAAFGSCETDTEPPLCAAYCRASASTSGCKSKPGG